MYSVMDYTYLYETKATNKTNKIIQMTNINNVNYINNANKISLHILCYHITETTVYPFLQFMMENLLEQFTLPLITVNKTDLMGEKSLIDETIIKEKVIHKIKTLLHIIGITVINNHPNILCKGLITIKDNQYVLVDVTGLDITGLYLTKNSPAWFVLPSEIINIKKICNISIGKEATELFIKEPKLALLTDKKTSKTYMIPDAVYNGSEFKNVEFNSVFGNLKTKEYENCGEYYYFHKLFCNAVRYGGWTKEGGTNVIDIADQKCTHNTSGRLIVDNKYGQYITGGINRYALFADGQLCFNPEELNDDKINALYPEPTIHFCTINAELKPNILAKHCSQFASLSYHTINKGALNEAYNEKTIANNCVII
jgi:hypothetical protein